jgi:DNA-binding NarL/FixJ family response regulator
MDLDLKDLEAPFMKFDALMQFRVRHILLVSSLYDSYVLEEDGRLTDLVFSEHLEYNLAVTPRVRRASTAEEALNIISRQDIDIVLVFKRVGDLDLVGFGANVKKAEPDMPVVFLAYDEKDLAVLTTPESAKSVDWAFLWTGDVRILMTIIKLVEDSRNVDHDTRLVGVRVIVIVEDSVRFCSSFLPMLYSEIMEQTMGLMAEGLNLSDKLLRMRARPKILLAGNYEQALELVRKYREYLLAVISDFRFPKDGRIDESAGLGLVRRIREDVPDVPIIMQSSDQSNAEAASAVGLAFLHKQSRTLHSDLRAYIMRFFGFGTFEFRLPDGTIVAGAGDLRALEKCLETVSEEALLYHAGRNHFSNWLMARTEFDLALRLRPRKVGEFRDADSVRRYLIDTLRSFRHEKQMGVVSDFSRRQFDLQMEFARIGAGSLGGKGRGLAFVNALLSSYHLYEHFPGVRLTVPHTVILGTDVFDEFVEGNRLSRIALGDHTEEIIWRHFLSGKFPGEIVAALQTILDSIRYPLAVRSSSLLEDSHRQPFAGIYNTHMLVNAHADDRVRLQQLEAAIKTVYASTYFEKARVYHESSGNRIEDEKMAVIIQQMVGTRHGELFYPAFSGVGLSYNYYSTNEMQPEDGIIYVALGLGKTIVDGLNCLRFSPSHPEMLPQFSTSKDFLKQSQLDFFAVDMSDPGLMPTVNGDENLAKLPITRADADDGLGFVASTYSPESDRMYDGLRTQGVRIISFAPILKSGAFPLADMSRFLLKTGSQGLNCPVEIEFAVNFAAEKGGRHDFYFLQIRPMAKDSRTQAVSLEGLDDSHAVLRSDRALGNILSESITDIVFVRPDTFDRSMTVRIADEIGRLNEELKTDAKPYVLIGPGRWGSSERWLGIPVSWNQISGARVITEAAYQDFAPEPSLGTHFLQNIVSLHIGYLTINQANGNGFVDWDWLLAQPVAHRTEHVTHIRLDKPIRVLIDGRVGKSVVLR